MDEELAEAILWTLSLIGYHVEYYHDGRSVVFRAISREVGHEHMARAQPEVAHHGLLELAQRCGLIIGDR